jgi:DNA replication protein DnaC
MSDPLAITESLGVCGCLLKDGSQCMGRILSLGQEGVLLEGECENPNCKAAHAIPIGKVKPEVLVARRLEQAELPARFLGLTFDEDDHNCDTLRTLREWIKDYSNGPLPAPALWGEPGRGKTHLLTLICIGLIRKYKAQVWFCSARSLTREMRDFDNERDNWSKLVGVEVLVIDDLGAQRPTEWRNDLIAELVDSRYESERPILVASNLPPEAWVEERAIDRRTESRLVTGMTFGLELKGPDRRALENGQNGSL